MGRRIRFIPEGGSLVEVTCRTIQGRFLLRPSRELNAIVAGILARAARTCSVQVMGAVYLSNHYHLLVWVRDALQLARFMNFLNGNLARKVGKLHDWRDRFWSRRYQAILVSDEEEAQVARLKYLLSHGAKEGLVAQPEDWPGIHCAHALRTGKPLKGIWPDPTGPPTRIRPNLSEPTTSGIVETLLFSPLPCWAHLTSAQYQQRIADLLAAVGDETGRTRERRNVHLPARRVCRRRICRQAPHARPLVSARRPAPLVHAFRKIIRKEIYDAYGRFVTLYRNAAAQLRAGLTGVRFPAGSFPPPMPFVAPPLPRGP